MRVCDSGLCIYWLADVLELVNALLYKEGQAPTPFSSEPLGGLTYVAVESSSRLSERRMMKCEAALDW